MQLVLAGSLASLLGACGGSGATSAATVSHTSAASPPLRRAVGIARRVYANEVNGGRVRFDLKLVAGDPVLLEDLSRGELAAAQAEARSLLPRYRADHITRVSLINGGRMVVNAVWNSNGTFVVAPLQQALVLHGRRMGTLLVSVQDVVGFVKLAHKFTGDEILVRGSSGQLRASAPALVGAALPGSGPVTIAGRRYEVASFEVRGWPAETLTVSVLQPA